MVLACGNDLVRVLDFVDLFVLILARWDQWVMMSVWGVDGVLVFAKEEAGLLMLFWVMVFVCLNAGRLVVPWGEVGFPAGEDWDRAAAWDWGPER